MNKKGVTLIELIIVFVIIGIMAAFLAPSVSSWLPRYRLRSATRDIVSTMRTCQIKAISYSGRQYLVNFNIGTNSYVLQYNTGGLGPYNDGPVQTAPPGITINTSGLLGGTAAFNTDASCPNGGSITLSYQKNGVPQGQKGISINPATGKVTIQ